MLGEFLLLRGEILEARKALHQLVELGEILEWLDDFLPTLLRASAEIFLLLLGGIGERIDHFLAGWIGRCRAFFDGLLHRLFVLLHGFADLGRLLFQAFVEFFLEIIHGILATELLHLFG